MLNLRKVLRLSLIVGSPLVLAFALNSYLFPPNPDQPVTEKGLAALAATMPPKLREIVTAPPFCWGYDGPHHVWLEQDKRTDATSEDLLAHAERLRKAWLDSIGDTPPLTCEEYENL